MPTFQKGFRNGLSSHSALSHEPQTSGIPETNASGLPRGESHKTQVQENFKNAQKHF